MTISLSNRTKRNIAIVATITGIIVAIARGWQVALNPTSGLAWFEFCSIAFLTGLCIDSVIRYHRATK